MMTGTLLNAAGILAGCIAAIATTRQLTTARQIQVKMGLGLLFVASGLHMTWTSFGGSFGTLVKQFTILILSMMLGQVVGRLLRLQKTNNRLGLYARERFEAAAKSGPGQPGDGFLTSTLLFCATPIAVLGAVQEGAAGRWDALALKAVLDGLATASFARTLGWGAGLSVIPVTAYQGTLTLATRWFVVSTGDPALAHAMTAVCGMLIFSMALLVLEVRKIQVADYLPALAIAPLITWLWR